MAVPDARPWLIPFLVLSLVAYTALAVVGTVVYLRPPAPDAGIPINVIASGIFTAVWRTPILVMSLRWIASGTPAQGDLASAFVLDCRLSPREREVAQAILNGATSKEIGRSAFISRVRF